MNLASLLIDGQRRVAALEAPGLVLLKTDPGLDLGDLLRQGVGLPALGTLAADGGRIIGAAWSAGDYPPEDSLYLWGPAVPAYFIHNSEA